MDVHSIQYQLCFICFLGIDDDHTIIQCSGYNIGSFVCDSNGGTGYLDSVRRAGSGIPLQGNVDTGTFIICCFKISVRKIVRDGGTVLDVAVFG